MPIYEYRCSLCGERFEKLIRSTSMPVEVRCPACNAEKVDRQISLFGLGSGASGESFASASGCNTGVGG